VALRQVGSASGWLSARLVGSFGRLAYWVALERLRAALGGSSNCSGQHFDGNSGQFLGSTWAVLGSLGRLWRGSGYHEFGFCINVLQLYRTLVWAAMGGFWRLLCGQLCGSSLDGSGQFVDGSGRLLWVAPGLGGSWLTLWFVGRCLAALGDFWRLWDDLEHR